MEMKIYAEKEEMARAAAAAGAAKIRETLAKRGEANIILATGASQLEMLACLVMEENIDWSKVTLFNLDEYIGLPEGHPANFRKYLEERFIEKLPGKLKAEYLVDSAGDPEACCRTFGKIIQQHPVDVAFIGIGENAHLAFNDPPADFDTEEPFIVVALDEACRKQQFGEGWFSSLDEVPGKGITMSIPQIMKSRSLIVTVPDERKAVAVKNALEGEIDRMVPASILRTHPDCHLFFDEAAASLLKSEAESCPAAVVA